MDNTKPNWLARWQHRPAPEANADEEELIQRALRDRVAAGIGVEDNSSMARDKFEVRATKFSEYDRLVAEVSRRVVRFKNLPGAAVVDPVATAAAVEKEIADEITRFRAREGRDPQGVK